jgi:hypothetical protein
MLVMGSQLGSEGQFFVVKKLANQYRDGVFEKPALNWEARLGSDEKEKRFRLGEDPRFQDQRSDQYLKGNYGILYTITLVLDNRDHNQSRHLEVVFVPAGGMVRGTFQIHDEILETPVLKTKAQESVIKKIELFPHEVRKLVIQTMPQPGAYYPANLIIRDVNFK